MGVDIIARALATKKGGEGGSQVIPNPGASESAELLTSLGIDGENFRLGGSGGGVEVVDSLPESGEINKLYKTPDGNIWSWQEGSTKEHLEVGDVIKFKTNITEELKALERDGEFYSVEYGYGEDHETTRDISRVSITNHYNNIGMCTMIENFQGDPTDPSTVVEQLNNSYYYVIDGNDLNGTAAAISFEEGKWFKISLNLETGTGTPIYLEEGPTFTLPDPKSSFINYDDLLPFVEPMSTQGKWVKVNGAGIEYYQVSFHDNKFYHNDTELTYNDLVEVMNDQTKFLWLSLNNLVYIPNITVDDPNGAIAFSTTFVRDDNPDELDYNPYISRIIINSDNVVGFEEFQLTRQDDIEESITTNNLKVNTKITMPSLMEVENDIKVNDDITMSFKEDTIEISNSEHTADLMFVDNLERNEENVYDYVITGHTNNWGSRKQSSVTNLSGINIWYLDNHTYYSYSGEHYEFNEETATWVPKTWAGEFYVDGRSIWQLGDDVYYSSNTTHRKLNRDTDTWESTTWGGSLYTCYGYNIWTRGNDVYYSSGSSQFKLNVSGRKWTSYVWNGLTKFNGYRIWKTDDHIYYSDGATQYELSTTNPSTWIPKTWNGLTNFNGDRIWKLDEHIYYSDGDGKQYELNESTSTWEPKVWENLNVFYGDSIWKSGNHTYVIYGDNQYELEPIYDKVVVGTKPIYSTPIIKHTYAELKELKDNKQLVPGTWYRITDFVTTCNNNVTALKQGLEEGNSRAKSAGHPFDILVMATGVNEFSHNAMARVHEGDTYFVNSKLENWVLEYDFENNINKYAWADIVNGKGVIYRMVDEWDNDISYDFKNIMFYRNKDLYDFGQVTEETSVTPHTMKDMMCAEDGYYYTFAYFKDANSPQLDATTAKTCRNNSEAGVNANKISYTTEEIRTLTNNVFVYAAHTASAGDNPWCNDNSLQYFYANTINMNDCDANTCNYVYNNVVVGRQFQLNNIKYAHDNLIYGSNFNYNTIIDVYSNHFTKEGTKNNIMSHVYNNTLGKSYDNILSRVHSNTSTGNMYNNNFSYVYSNTFNSDVYYNKFTYVYTNNFYAKVYSNVCVSMYKNTFNGEVYQCNINRFNDNICNALFVGVSSIGQCNQNVFCNLRYCTINPICSALNFGNDESLNLTFATFKSIRGESATNRLDLSGLLSLISRASVSGIQRHYTIEGSENGKVLCYWLDDSGNRKGYYLDNGEWKALVVSEGVSETRVQELIDASLDNLLNSSY